MRACETKGESVPEFMTKISSAPWDLTSSKVPLCIA